MCINIRTPSQCMQHTKHYVCTKRHRVDMRQSTVEFNYIVYAEVQWKKNNKKKSTAFSIAQDFITCQIIAHCPGQHDEKLYPMPARQQKYIQCTVAQAISESSPWVSIIAQLKTYIQKTASFCLSTLALCSQTCIGSASYPPEPQGTELLFSCREQCAELQKLLHP